MATGSWAQVNNLRCQWVAFQQEAIQPDSLTIAPESIVIKATQPASSFPEQFFIASYNPQKNEMVLKVKEGVSPSVLPDSILICYRVFPINFSEKIFNRSQAVYDTGGYRNVFQDLQDVPVATPREELFPTEGLNKSGSITRGISAGNTQDAFVNSALNLQLEGKLSDDLDIKAVFSDQNVPFQPEGNTLQLQEFDKVFMELKHKNGKLAAGDIVLQNDSSEFMRYYKNVQGGQLQLNFEDTVKRISSNTRIGGAIAKGQFRSQQVEPLEGVMGPYRLTGPNNERFIIVIANSEKVFLDGRRLTRGFNYDYVIDYNTAEITFMNTVLITKFSRIRVDFEFSNQNYNRSILQADHRQKVGKVEVYAQAYQEKDSKQNPLLFQLTEENQRLMQEAGDQAIVIAPGGADTVGEFNPSRILYTQIDTTVGTESFQVFRRATLSDTSLYTVTFLDLGQGNGNYQVSTAPTNGRVFEWVVPLNGIPQGTHEPGRALVPPNKKQLLTAGAKVHLTGNDYVFAEAAFSDHDLNLFSSLDAEDNKGFAVKMGYRNQGRPVHFLEGYQWTGGIDVEFDNEYFRPIDRFRYIEYDRDWSVNDTGPAEDKIFNVRLGLKKDQQNTIDYRFSRRQRDLAADGWQQSLVLNKQLGKLQLVSNAFLLDNELGGELEGRKSEWARVKADLSFRGEKLVPGYIYQLDKNRIYQTATDSVVSTAMNFEEHLFYLQSGDSLKTKFRIDYSLREDKSPQQGELQATNQASTLNISAGKDGKKGKFRFSVVYRQLENLNLAGNPIEETLNGRFDWSQQFLDRHIRSELSYVTGSGRELKREFIFVQVDAGQGTHTWRDDNGDGIQDLNEFYLAINPDEKNYAKFFTPTDEYIAVFHTQINYRLNMEGPRNWAEKGGFKSFVSKLSSVSSITINSRISDSDILARLFPFLVEIPPESLLANNTIFRNTLFFNRKSPVYGFEGRVLYSDNKQLLTNGFEQRTNENYALSYRWNVTKKVNTKLEVETGSLGNISDFLENRNYQIDQQKIGGEASYQPENNLRFTFQYSYKVKDNALAIAEETAEEATFHEYGFNARWAKAVKRSIVGSIKVSDIQFVGKENTPSGYAMLEALRPGTNFTWSVSWLQRLANGLQLNVSYNGRQSPNQQMVHLGRMQVTALF
ncbi:hypothetical protein R9C00_02810 [Flammeovirgaceae bacterium SG7u.111]|nr:hypothetical protein [Flammeovirgaceae bacterium SG7u.132]WPO36371.1 hypothetical protein R9C00_02810 [Flammeovirgaceae bacterium SG7u.111]